MDHRLKLLLAAAASVAVAGSVLRPAPAPVVIQAAPSVIEHCRRAAELLYDVHWAATCFKLQDANDCTLPDALAAKVNAIPATEEARCIGSEVQARTAP